jgi:hypothetical protein
MTNSEQALGQAKRTERAHLGRWAVSRIAEGVFHVCNLENGSHTYEVTAHDGYTCTCKDKELHKSLRCKHAEVVRLLLEGEDLNVQPIVETDEAGITAGYFDGATISLTIGGRSACSKCGERLCAHYWEAVPYYARWKWKQAQAGRWPANRLIELGIPPIAVEPNLVGKPLTTVKDYTPTPVSVDGAKVYALGRGHVVHFDDGGHVFVGGIHPDGHTPCLGDDDACQSGECDHVARAMHICTHEVGDGDNALDCSVKNNGAVKPDHASEDQITQKKGQHIMSEKYDIKTVTGLTMAEVKELFTRVLPPKAYKSVPGGANLTDINPYYLAESLTEAFGPAGYGWWVDASIQPVEVFQETRVSSKGKEYTVWCAYYDRALFHYRLVVNGEETVVSIETNGGSDNSEREFAVRGALTSAIGGAAARLLWQLDVYKGLLSHRNAGRYQKDEDNGAGTRTSRPERGTTRTKPKAQVSTPAPSGDGAGGNGNMTADQAEAFVMPFGTREHPEYKGQTLGALAQAAPDLIRWLAGNQFQPKTGEGERVKVAALALAEAA